MKIPRFVQAAIACAAVAACVLMLGGCANSSSKGPVAATVNGEEIAEQTITDQIQQIRNQSGLSEEEEWGTFLAQSDMTPSSVRDQILDTKIDEKLVIKGAADLGVTVESSEVDEYVNQMKSNYKDDAAWKSALEQAGFTEESYREVITNSLYEQKVNEHFQESAEASDEDLVKSAQQYAPSYDGAKRSSHILFKVDDPSDEAAMAQARSQAESVLAQINAGTLDFAEAAKQYSGDTGSAQNGGDVGWDNLNSFVEAYTNALDGLELNQVSGLVQSDYGIHIIKVTDVYKAPEDPTTITSLDQLPTEFQENIKSMASSMNANTKYQEWLEGQKNNANIVKNDMPSGLPYDLDMSKYESAKPSTESESASASTSSDESTASETSSESSSSEPSSSESSSSASSSSEGSSSSSAAA